MIFQTIDVDLDKGHGQRGDIDSDSTMFPVRNNIDAPNLIINPIHVKLYKEDVFIASYPLYVLSTVRIGRMKTNEIHLTTPEISRNLLEIIYTKEGDMLVRYVGRTYVNISGRQLPSGEECTEEVVLGSELTFSDYKIVLSDNDKAQGEPLMYFKPRTSKHVSQGALSSGDKDITEDEILNITLNSKLRRLTGKKYVKLVIFAVIAVVAIIVGSRTYYARPAQQRPAAHGGQTTAQITRMDFHDTIRFPGIINFLDPVPVVNPMSGKILSIGFKDGEHVKEGQMLFKIDSSAAYQQLQQAKADYVTAGANLKKYESLDTSVEYSEISKNLIDAKNNLNRTTQRKQRAQRLVEKGILSKAELERTEVEYENARTQYENYEFKLKQVQISFATNQQLASLALNKTQKALNDAEKVYNSGEIKSPISGIVTVPVTNSGKVIYAVGQSINADSIVVYIGDYKNIGIKTEIPESQVQRLHEGQKVLISTEMFKDKTIDGILSEIAAVATIKETTSVFEARIKIINTDEIDRTIRFGLSAQATVIISEKPKALSVPIQAMIDCEGRPSVLYFDSNKDIKMAYIMPGLTNQGALELLSSTLPEGTVVLTSDVEETLRKLDKKKLIEEAKKLNDTTERHQ